MDAITPSALIGGGLPAAANALNRAQARFDVAAAAQVQAAEDLITDPSTDAIEGASSPDLTATTATMAQERLLNQILMGVFKAQDQQQQDLLRLSPS